MLSYMRLGNLAGTTHPRQRDATLPRNLEQVLAGWVVDRETRRFIGIKRKQRQGATHPTTAVDPKHPDGIKNPTRSGDRAAPLYLFIEIARGAEASLSDNANLKLPSEFPRHKIGAWSTIHTSEEEWTQARMPPRSSMNCHRFTQHRHVCLRFRSTYIYVGKHTHTNTNTHTFYPVRYKKKTSPAVLQNHAIHPCLHVASRATHKPAAGLVYCSYALSSVRLQDSSRVQSPTSKQTSAAGRTGRHERR